MTIKLEDLQAEKGLLQKDFDEMRRNISRVETDLAQMKANLNAINGAMQQTNKLIKMAAEAEVKVTPSVKAKKK
jgi:chromosome segregation ATPase